MKRSLFLTVLIQAAVASAAAIAYTLRDLFTTALSAGSVNGSAAEPSGGTRTVTDTNLKASIIGGVYSVATGGVGSGDPGMWYTSLTRTAGLTLIAIIVQTTNALEIGWDNNAAGTIPFAIRPVIGSSLGIRDNGTAITVGLSTISGTSYQVALVLRATGCFYFIKGGVFTFWTLVWVSNLSAINLIPGVANVANTDVYTVDDMRVPVPAYIPNPSAYDTFTRSNGALGSTETAGPDSQVIVALIWNFTTGIWTISTNKAIATPVPGSDVVVNGAFAADTDWTKGAGWTIAAGVATGSTASSNLTATVAPLTAGRWCLLVYTVSGFAAGTVQAVVGGKTLPTHAANATYTEIALATTTALLFTGAGFSGNLDNVSAKLLTTAELFATVACATADVMIDAAVTISGALAGLPAGIVVNLDSTTSPANFIVCYLDGAGNCVLVEFVAGTPTIKFTTAITYSAGAILRLERASTECRVFYNNLAVSTVQTMTANTNLNHGIFDPTASNSLDNLTIWPRGTSNEYTGLDTL